MKKGKKCRRMDLQKCTKKMPVCVRKKSLCCLSAFRTLKIVGRQTLCVKWLNWVKLSVICFHCILCCVAVNCSLYNMNIVTDFSLYFFFLSFLEFYFLLFFSLFCIRYEKRWLFYILRCNNSVVFVAVRRKKTIQM